MSFLKKIALVFKYGPEIEKILEEKRQAAKHAEWLTRQDNLHLCLRHQQEENKSHYSEKNCDHCKLIRRNNVLTAQSNSRGI